MPALGPVPAGWRGLLRKKTEQVELYAFAAASLTGTLDQIIEDYKAVAPHVTVVPAYDSSGTLLSQIQEGAECDLFLSAAQKQMDILEEEGFLLADTPRRQRHF